MSNRYDRDYPPQDPNRAREQGRREERYADSARREDDADPDYRSPSDYYRTRRFGEGPQPSARDDGSRPEYRGFDRSQEPRGWNARNARPEREQDYSSSLSRDTERYPESPSVAERYPRVRGVYQEQVWTRDPRTGEVYGYDYATHWPPSGAGSEAYHRPVRWRGEGEIGARDRTRDWNERSSREPRSFGHSGKGPKGYVRSDERIREDVSDRLSDDDEIDASDITVTVIGGEVRLEGTVSDRYVKHRAEDLAEAVSGVRDVTNNLRTRKGFFQELGDKLSGDDKNEHRGHAGSGTHDAPKANSTRGGMSASR